MTVQVPGDGVTFVNTFTLSASPAEFEAAFARTSQYMARQPGFIEHTLVRHMKDPGRYVNIARWRDAGSLQRAVARPEFLEHAAALRALASSDPQLYTPLRTVRPAPAEDGPVVVVTGGGTGIGRATAHAFAEQGARVLVVGRTPESLTGTAEGYDSIRTAVADLTTEGAAEEVVAEALRVFGRIDVLVNNAAVALHGTLADHSRKHDETQIATNLLAPIALTRAALEALEASGGTVVNVSTSGSLGLRTWPGASVYGASKVALDFLTRTWAVELAPRGIRVVGLAPGVVDSGIGVRMGMSQEQYAGFLAEMGSRAPAGRVGTPAEIGWWITQLARDEAGYANGVVVPVDGGLSLT
ncbi:SDR family oxidoreductase [Streptomyces virginiae]|uniref:SDR family oxidoreductase n=1 Tax=Streptomyces virginiae TaxID=1961 RepID=UPI002B1D6297|nr:SDR family oxidoreductase [Streptomyces virginiae]